MIDTTMRTLVIMLLLALSVGAAGETTYSHQLQRRAEQGDTEAQYNLGTCYEKGLNVQRDCSKAFYWWEKSADGGNLQACYMLGYIYRVGFSLYEIKSGDSTLLQLSTYPQVPKGGDINKSITYYKRCANSDIYPEAQYYLGKWYYEGELVERDYAQAFKYISWAAENKNLSKEKGMEMYQMLAACYRYGRGTQADSIKSKQCLYRSAELGNHDIQDMIQQGGYGTLYDENGLPYEPDGFIELIFMYKKSDEGKSKIELYPKSIRKGNKGRFEIDFSLFGEIMVMEIDGYEPIEFEVKPNMKLYLKRKK